MIKYHPVLESVEVSQYLAIAKRYAAYIRRSREIRIPGIIGDHATIVNVFSAAAIEAALNLYISIPLLLLEDRQSRSFFGPLITKYLRLSIRKKIGFARSASLDLRRNPRLCEQVNDLFNERNTRLHPTPIYSESSGIDFSSLRKIRFDGLKKHPVLTTIGVGSDDVRDSLENYSAACKFIQILDLDTAVRIEKRSSGSEHKRRTNSRRATR
jgi:hypothetical protein